MTKENILTENDNPYIKVKDLNAKWSEVCKIIL